jgi:hypothetical protein
MMNPKKWVGFEQEKKKDINISSRKIG